MLSSVAGTVKRAWPALVFLSLARAMSHRTAKNKLIPVVVTNQKKTLSAVAKSMPKSLAKATLVQLQVPVSGPMRMATIFSNDQILAKGVKGKRQMTGLMFSLRISDLYSLCDYD